MILLIDKSKSEASGLSQIFYYMGVLCNPLSPDAGEKIRVGAAEKYRAALVVRPEEFDEPEGLAARIRLAAGPIPVFAPCDAENVGRWEQVFDGAFPLGFPSPDLLLRMQEVAVQRRCGIPGIYRVAGVDISCHGEPNYFGTPFPLTRTECMILRVFALYYPMPLSAKTIRRFAYRYGTQSDASTVRTHICSINRKFAALTGRRLIAFTRGDGYTVLTPETATARKEEEKIPAKV